MIEMIELGQCCEIVNGSTPSRFEDKYWNGNIDWFTPKDLSKLEGKYLQDSPERITVDGYNSCSTTILPPNSLLFTSRAPIGHIAINTKAACTNQGFKSFIPKENVNVDYLYYVIKKFTPQLQDLGNGATFKELSKATVSSFKIPLPSLPQQQKIAAILDAADALRQNDKALIAKYDELTQALFLDMFGDPVSNPKGWEKRTGKEYCLQISVGVVIKPASYYVDSGVIALRAMNIRPNKIINNGFVYFSEHNHSTVLAKSIIYTNDVLIVRTGSTGTATVVPIAYNGCNCIDSIITRPNEKIINSIYLAYFFNSQRGKEMVAKNEVGGIQKHFNIGTLNHLEIPIPPVQFQNQFAERVAAIEEQKVIAQASLVKSEDLFNSLLQKAFKGELA
jgi:type I restriction enzyme S subunit